MVQISIRNNLKDKLSQENQSEIVEFDFICITCYMDGQCGGRTIVLTWNEVKYKPETKYSIHRKIKVPNVRNCLFYILYNTSSWE